MSEARAQIDIIIITHNSLEPVFMDTLTSIREQAELAKVKPRLIIVDKNSNDGTIELLNEFPDLNPIIFRDPDGNRATARQIGIEAVISEFFAFIDSDVILNNGWFTDALSWFTRDEIGAVWGQVQPIDQSEKKYRKAMSVLTRKKIDEAIDEYSDIRGLTHDTMIRTQAVSGIKIPKELHVFEDHYIRLYVEKNGYKWINATKPNCLHSRHDRIGKSAYMDMYYGWYFGSFNLSYLLKHFFMAPVKIIWLLIYTLDLEIVYTEFIKEINIYRGIFEILYNKLTNRRPKILKYIEEVK